MTLNPYRLALIVCLLPSGLIAAQGSLYPENLRTEYLREPIGLGVSQPRFSWINMPTDSTLRGQQQTAWQVRVSTSVDALPDSADLWDSGRTSGSEAYHIVYGGDPLPSRTRAWWSVRVWDREGQPSEWSDPASFEIGLLNPDEWQARWIASPDPVPMNQQDFYAIHPAPLFRKAFTTDRKVRQARIYATGLGYYELTLNGARLDDRMLDPGWTNTDRRVLYAVYDVTDRIRDGANAIGVEVGNGWYNPLPLPIFRRFNLREILPVGRPKALVQLEITFTDGTRQVVATDDTWRTAHGPVLKNNIYLGEVYDARKELPGWNTPSFSDAGWKQAVEVDGPGGHLQAQEQPPIRPTRTVRPIAVTEPAPGVFIVDMGQNFAGVVAMNVSGRAGTKVTLRYGELLSKEGRLNPLTSVAGQIKDWDAANARDWDRLEQQPWWSDGPVAPATAWAADTYILKGSGVEIYRTRFSWHGFRYVEIRGYPGRPDLGTLIGYALNSDVPTAGTFTCSNDLFNRVQHLTMWAQLSNMFSVQSDCPHRERFGYGGDIVATTEMAMLNLDMARFYVKQARDFADAQRPNGGFTEIAPDVGIADEGLGEGTGPIGWGLAHPVLVRDLYRYYGDRRFVEEQYENVRKYADFVISKASGHLLDYGISDHESLSPKPKVLTGTAFYHAVVTTTAELAEILGRKDDAAHYAGIAGEIRRAFEDRFYDAATGRVGTGTQASQAFALYHRLVPESARQKALDALVDSVMNGSNGHLTTGIFGTKYLLDVLSASGRFDVAYTVANQRSYPGWGYMVENGATTLWETWKKDDLVYSLNHEMFGSVSEWYYKWVAGIQPAPDAVGFNRIIIRPNLVEGLEWANARHTTIHGDVGSAWKKEGDVLRLDVTIPVGATAEIHVPATCRNRVWEGNLPAHAATGVMMTGMDHGAVIYRVGPGTYHFTSREMDDTKHNCTDIR